MLKSGDKSTNDIKFPDKYYSVFTRSFSPIVIESLINTGKSLYLSEILTNSGIINDLNLDMKLSEYFDWLYKKMEKSYRSEYIYKNALVNKIVLGKHSINTSYMLTEFRVEKCRADVVILNGTSNVYEIKSEYYRLDRIQTQVQSYMKMFDFVNVITSSSQINKITDELPPSVGILELNKRYRISEVRPAKSLKFKVNQETIISSLRKSEYLKIIKALFGSIPNVPNTRIYEECKKLFLSLKPEVAHDEMVKILKQRGDSKVLRDVILDIPDSLKAYFIDRNLSDDYAKKLDEFLQKPLKSILG